MPTGGGRVITKVSQLADWNQAAIADGQVVKYNAGLDKYVGGAGDAAYVYDQTVAASTWTINHNLGKYPSVTVVDSSGNLVQGTVSYPSTSTVVITFFAAGNPVAFGGHAYLN